MTDNENLLQKRIEMPHWQKMEIANVVVIQIMAVKMRNFQFQLFSSL
jgi:hypothetical protein